MTTQAEYDKRDRERRTCQHCWYARPRDPDGVLACNLNPPVMVVEGQNAHSVKPTVLENETCQHWRDQPRRA